MEIKAFSNVDSSMIVWKYDSVIPNCYGFALYRKYDGEDDSLAEPLPTWVGFVNQSHNADEFRPSTVWPIQKYMWTDYTVTQGKTVCYKVVPMLWDAPTNTLVKDASNTSPWSNEVSIASTGQNQAYFNRGIISSQFLIKELPVGGNKTPTGTLSEELTNETSPIRKFLGGCLSDKLFELLDEVIQNPQLEIYASLYELNEPFLIQRLNTLKTRAHVILANGAFKSNGDDENQEVRVELKDAGVDVIDRLVTLGHFAHNKFLVVFDTNTQTCTKIWTGSTNWTEHGLYTQVNNGLLIGNEVIAKWYKEEWDLLASISKNAGSSSNLYPAELMQSNSAVRVPAVPNTNVWFAPVYDFVDLNAAKALMNNAKNGIMFLFFNPGTHDTLFNTILDLQNAPGNNLFFHGIINQDPGGKQNPLVLYHRGNPTPMNFSTVMPKAVDTDFGYWKSEIKPQMVTIHSKVVLIDPFGENPVVITGSHNLGPKASQMNDDNMIIIQNDKKLAEAYAVHIMAVYNHFRFRYFMSLNANSTTWQGLQSNDKWQAGYLTGEKQQELDFWLA